MLLTLAIPVPHQHKHTARGCRGCGRNPNAVKVAIIGAKIFNIWAIYTATFTFE